MDTQNVAQMSGKTTVEWLVNESIRIAEERGHLIRVEKEGLFECEIIPFPNKTAGMKWTGKAATSPGP